MDATDAVLVEQCLAGNDEMYNTLIHRHQDAVFNLLLKMTGHWHDADELTQETFLRAYRRLGAYDPRYSFKNWVITIAVNLAKNRWRSFWRRRRAEEAAAAPDWSAPADPSDPRLDALHAALQRLPERLRTPLVLRHMEDYSYAEIARTLGIGLSAAKMRVLRAREELARELESTS
jgi:RNA polymerase sigma-70 factor (ECF subfamily)